MTNSKERALVTGASSGIGREIARVLAAQGCDLVICARRTDELDALASELLAAHGKPVQVVTADLSTAAGVDSLISAAGDDLDIVVNNAGFGTTGDHIDRSAASQLGMVDLNVRALTHLSHHYCKVMAAKGSGRILNVASIAAYQPGPTMATYCATKSYVLSYSRALRSELKPKGVTVTALCPGPVLTGFQDVADLRLTASLKMYLVSPQKVAKVAVKAMRKGKREILPGIANKPLPLLTRVTPVWFQMLLMKSMLKSTR